MKLSQMMASFCVLMGICAWGLGSQPGESARMLSGHVYHDGNNNGAREEGEETFSDILISDGVNFVRTDFHGRYALPARAGQLFVVMHKPSDLDPATFYHRLTADNNQYDFLVKRVVPRKSARFLAVGDQETDAFGWVSPLKRHADTLGNVDFLMLCGDISANGSGLEEHAQYLTRSTMGMPVYSCIGNHDILPAGSKTKSYAETCGPYWYSFEYGEVLFVVGPMYHCFSPPLPYRLDDFGQWLAKLLSHFPRTKPKVLISHDLLNRNEMVVDCGPARIDLAEHHFVAYIHGHKHMNAMRSYSRGVDVFTMAPPNKGGCGQFPPSFEVFEVLADGRVVASLRYMGLDKTLSIACPAPGMVCWKSPHALAISVIAYDTSTPVTEVNARVTDKSGKVIAASALTQASDFSWEGAAAWTLPPCGEACQITVTAALKEGTTLRADREFIATPAPRPLSPPNDRWTGLPGASDQTPARRPGDELHGLTLAWIASLPGTTALAGPLVADGMVLVAVSDDAMSQNGGVYALDAASGRTRWFYRSGYSIRNTMNWSQGRLFAIDTNATIHAIDTTTGACAWKNPGIESETNPSASGLVVADGIVVGGYGAQLRACDANTGQTIWRNTWWTERTPGTDSLSAGNGNAYVISQLNGLYAHDLKTGEIRFRFDRSYLSGTAIPADDALFVKGSNSVCCLEGRRGMVLHEKKLGQASTAFSPVVLDDRILVGTNNEILAIDRKDFRELWSFKPRQAILDTTTYAIKTHAIEATPVVRGATAWFGASDGYLRGLDVATGKPRHAIDVGFPITSSVAVVDDWLYLVDMAGRVMAFKATPGATATSPPTTTLRGM